MKSKVFLLGFLGVLAFVLTSALIATLVLKGTNSSNEESVLEEQVPKGERPRPAPPSGGPIAGEKVSLEEARLRIPYSIPIPADFLIDSEELVEVWVSYTNRPLEYQQVYLIYSNGLKISIGGRPDPIDYSTLVEPPFQAAKVRGIPASGKDPLVTQSTMTSTNVKSPGNVSWWDNGIDIGIYHPEFSMNELLRIAESMPEPVWKP